MSKIDVAVLLDLKNNWLEKYIKTIVDIEELKNRYNFIFFYNPDVIKDFELVFILGYTRILNKNFLESNKFNLVVHESNLPEGKGFSPIQWQIIQGKNEIYISLVDVVEEVDSGDIFEQEIIKFNGYELFDEIRLKQAKSTINIIRNFLNKYPNISSYKQNGKGSFYPRRTEKDDELDINKTILDQFNHFRIANNEQHPLYFVIDGHKYYLKVNKEKN